MKKTLTRAPQFINWNFTNKCSFNCEHCYSRNRVIETLTLEEKMKICENIARNKVFIVNLGGGEPILDKDCYKVIEYLSNHGVRTNLSTSGWDINLNVIADLQKANLQGASISIDNIDPTIHDSFRHKEGAFNKALEAIQLFVANKIDVVVSTVITTMNFDSLEDIISLADSLGCKGIDLKRLKTMGNAADKNELILNKDQEALLYEKMKEWKAKYQMAVTLTYSSEAVEGIDGGCPCGKTALCILENGDVSPCVYNTIVVGNAINDDLSELWLKNPTLTYLRDNFTCVGLFKKGQLLYDDYKSN